MSDSLRTALQIGGFVGLCVVLGIFFYLVWRHP